MSDNGHREPSEIAEEHKAKGSVMWLEDMMRQDGILAEHVDKMGTQQQGVIQRIISPSTDKDYRQILKMARWRDDKEIDLFSKALAACDITGATMARKILLDNITSRSAGLGAELTRLALDALTHTTFTTQKIEAKKKGQNEYYNRPTSPLST